MRLESNKYKFLGLLACVLVRASGPEGDAIHEMTSLCEPVLFCAKRLSCAKPDRLLIASA